MRIDDKVLWLKLANGKMTTHKGKIIGIDNPDRPRKYTVLLESGETIQAPSHQISFVSRKPIDFSVLFSDSPKALEAIQSREQSYRNQRKDTKDVGN